MSKIDLEKVQNLIREVADEVIVPRFRNLGAGDISFKGEDDPFTIADKQAELALQERLLDLLPGSKVLGEEAFAANRGLLDQFSGESPVWIIDPIDGTKAFIAGEPVYGVIVALAERNETVAGWLYDPTSKEFVTAEVGAGAYHQGRRLSVLPPTPVESMRGMLGYLIRDKLEPATCQTETLRVPEICRILSACHDYASLVVADSHFSGRTRQTHFYGTYCTCTPWDNAAGVLIHAEAGGYSAHWDGEPFRPSHYGKGLLSAPNKESWHELKNWLAQFCVGLKG